VSPVSDEDDYAPMVIASFRLPASLLADLDRLADLGHKRRADIVREALTAYVVDRTAPVRRSEAEHALEVLGRLVRDAGLPIADPAR
jgi:predicted transcriptional regulator